MFFGVASTFFSSFGQTFFVSLSAPMWIGAFAMSNATWGALYSTATLASALCLPYVGGLLDRVALKKFSTLVWIAFAAACLLLSVSQYVWMLFIALLGLRMCGQGLQGLIASTTMARAFTANRGTALSISSTGFPLGEIVFPPSAVVTLNAFGWRTSWVMVSVILIVAVLPLIRWLLSDETKLPDELRNFQNRTSHPNSDPQTGQTRGQILKGYRFYLIMPAYIAPAFIATGFILNQFFIAEEQGWSETMMANSFVAFGICRLAFSLFAGPMIDRWGARQLFPFYLVPLVAGIGAMIVFKTPATAVVYYGLMGITNGIGTSIGAALWAETYGTRHLGAIKSMASMILILSTAVSPVVIGLLLDYSITFQQIFSSVSLLVIVFAIMSFFGCRASANPE